MKKLFKRTQYSLATSIRHVGFAEELPVFIQVDFMRARSNVHISAGDLAIEGLNFR